MHRTRTPLAPRRTSRLAASCLSAGLLIGVVPAAGTAAAAPVGEARDASKWIATQVDDGRIRNIAFDFDDWGLTIDGYLALVASGTKPGLAATMIRTVSRNVDAYVQFDGDYFAGPVAKMLLARRVANLSGLVMSADLHLRQQLSDMVAPTGRVRDTGNDDFSSTISQSLSVLALVRSGRVPQQVVDYLLRQQCSAGYFAETLAKRGCDRAGATPYVDATAFAAQALLAAWVDGADVPRGALRRVGDWLVEVQGANGGFDAPATGGTPNSNTTGLAAQAVAALGRDAAADRAKEWVLSVQITAAKAAGGPAADDLGAIAYGRAELRAALDEGITDQTRDQWRRSTPQAQLALKPVPLGVLSADG